MPAREWQIGIVGTFDVENYGDLLFPLLAERELGERLGAVRVHAFSYRSRARDAWPYPVTPVDDLPGAMPGLDAMLVGGGYLVRFDKEVAPGYLPSSDAIHHPTGYWLTPALVALQHGVPVVWNAPGMHCNELPRWSWPLLRLALAESAYVAVRDELTRAALAPFAGACPVVTVPDTAFALPRTVASHAELAPELARLRRELGIEGRRYVVVQAADGIVPFARFLAANGAQLGDLAIVALPVSPALTENGAIIRHALPRAVSPERWPHPLVIAGLVGGAEAVAGHSYHLAITALTAGVPVFSPSGREGKFSIFSGIGSIHPLPVDDAAGVDAFLARLGRRAPPRELEPLVAGVAAHWDRVAAAIRGGPTGSRAAVGRFLQSLPGILEEGATGTVESDDASHA
jgi:lipopolysaccharide transport system ATP-binding protein